MGKLLTGRFGEEPEAESVIPISLRECHQRLCLKPSDFISEGAPDFFNKSYSAKGRYLVFHVDGPEVSDNPIWKAGYYLLPIEAVDVIRAFDKSKRGAGGAGERTLPVEIECKETIPPAINDQCARWAKECQPLFFKCKCDNLTIKLTSPWGMRRKWRAKLSCPDRCQPTLATEFLDRID